jgi:N6-L-threonylcarbamoyladenine synthase
MVPHIKTLVAAGGVAANHSVRKSLQEVSDLELVVPPIKWCTDNAAMIALAGIERYALGLEDGLDLPARARWPLDPNARRVAHNRSDRP